MAITVSNLLQVRVGRLFLTTAQLTFSGNYTTGGDTLSLIGGLNKSTKVPLFVSIEGDNGYTYEYINGADQSVGLVKVLQCAAATNPQAEVAQAGYNANVISDTVMLFMMGL